MAVPDFLAAWGCPDPDGNSEATSHLSEIFAVRTISAHAPWVSAVPTRRLGSCAATPCVFHLVGTGGHSWVQGALESAGRGPESPRTQPREDGQLKIKGLETELGNRCMKICYADREELNREKEAIRSEKVYF